MIWKMHTINKKSKYKIQKQKCSHSAVGWDVRGHPFITTILTGNQDYELTALENTRYTLASSLLTGSMQSALFQGQCHPLCELKTLVIEDSACRDPKVSFQAGKDHRTLYCICGVCDFGKGLCHRLWKEEEAKITVVFQVSQSAPL